jgi:sporulation protein YlmC with PRC-barrel domain
MDQRTDNKMTEFIIGSEVVGDEGVLGKLTRVVVDPIAKAVTHLVVEPQHRRDSGHLVPVDRVSATGNDEIRLRCSACEFSALPEAEDRRFIAGADNGWYQQSQMLTLPYYSLDSSQGPGARPHEVVSDRVPDGDVDIHRGEHVHATNGEIGRVQGLVIDPDNHSVTHVLLDEGHLWGKKRVAIPIAAVTGVEDGIRLRLSKQEIDALPETSINEPA